MLADDKGFLYPVPNTQRCTDCHLCERVCPILHDTKERTPSHAFAMMNKDEQVRLASSSGGVFSVMAEEVIDAGGVVYGASFDENWEIRHIVITKKEDLTLLRGSKYAQSSMGTIYREVRKRLQKGERVLFSGTPCQIAGLKHFLNKNYDCLTTVDVICHGVPNPRIWKEYIDEEITNRHGDQKTQSAKTSIEQLNFRNKTNGWKNYHFYARLIKNNFSSKEKEELSEHHRNNLYMKLFLDDYILRPSCYSCQFRKGRSGADFTLGDFWGIQDICQNMDDDKGTSLLLEYEKDTNSFPKLWQRCLFSETQVTKAINKNPAYHRDWVKNRFSSFFYFLHDSLSCSLKRSWEICDKLNHLISRLGHFLVFSKLKKKKIAVITFFQTEDNYGQLLQCYALQQALRQLGATPYVIRYGFHYKYIHWLRWQTYFTRHGLYSVIKALRSYYKKFIKAEYPKRGFVSFRKKYIYFSNRQYNSLEELQTRPPHADIYITGSD